jgi:hypothetical protein
MSRFRIACRNAALLALVIPATLTAVRPSHGALWEYRFTGVFYSDPGQATGYGVGVGIFDGIDGTNPQGASFIFSAVFDDTNFLYTPPQWDGTNYFLEWFTFPVVTSTMTRNGQSLSLPNGSFEVERSSSGTYIWLHGSSVAVGTIGADQTVLSQSINPFPMLPNPLVLTPFSGGSGEGLHSQYAVSSLRYRFNDASLTLVPAPSTASLIALAVFAKHGRRRK